MQQDGGGLSVTTPPCSKHHMMQSMTPIFLLQVPSQHNRTANAIKSAKVEQRDKIICHMLSKIKL